MTIFKLRRGEEISFIDYYKWVSVLEKARVL